MCPVCGLAWFAQQNVTIERVTTDNGSAFLAHKFAKTCARLKVRHKRTRPYTPRTNGKAERFIHTLLREWAYRRTKPRKSASDGSLLMCTFTITIALTLPLLTIHQSAGSNDRFEDRRLVSRMSWFRIGIGNRPR